MEVKLFKEDQNQEEALFRAYLHEFKAVGAVNAMDL